MQGDTILAKQGLVKTGGENEKTESIGHSNGVGIILKITLLL
jgi:hypothetical protein